MVEHATVLDSDEQQVGSLYAKALLGSAGSGVEEIVSQLESLIRECLDKHHGLESVLRSPRVSQEDKEAMLDRIFRGRVHNTLLNFLKVLCRRGRIGSLRTIQAVATEMWQQQLGRQKVLVGTAQPLTDDQRRDISEALKAALGKDAVLVEQVDDTLMGGIVLRIGDQVIDGSMLGRMRSLRAAVSERVQRAVREQFDSLLSG